MTIRNMTLILFAALIVILIPQDVYAENFEPSSVDYDLVENEIRLNFENNLNDPSNNIDYIFLQLRDSDGFRLNNSILDKTDNGYMFLQFSGFTGITNTNTEKTIIFHIENMNEIDVVSITFNNGDETDYTSDNWNTIESDNPNERPVREFIPVHIHSDYVEKEITVLFEHPGKEYGNGIDYLIVDGLHKDDANRVIQQGFRIAILNGDVFLSTHVPFNDPNMTVEFIEYGLIIKYEHVSEIDIIEYGTITPANEPNIHRYTGLFTNSFIQPNQPETSSPKDIALEKAKKKSGGSDSQWKTKPTFGVSHQTDKPIVECGFSWNDICYDVIDNWHTQMEFIKVKIDDSNKVKLKGFFQHPPLFMEFGLTPEIGHLHKAESLVTIFFDGMNEPTIDRVEIVQERDIIDDSITADLNVVPCGYINDECYEITIDNLTFNEIPEFEVVGINAVDTKRRNHITYFNDGIQVEPSAQQLLAQYILDQQVILPEPEEECIARQVLQRYDCNFNDVMEQQRTIAEQTFDNIIR